jgi:hypothetical protein
MRRFLLSYNGQEEIMMAEESGSGTSPLVVALVAVLSALIGAGATLGVAYFTFASKDQELKVHLVEIAIGILRADPKEDVTPARGWALDVIEKNSGVPFTPQDREALLHKPLSGKIYWMSGNASDAMTKLGFPWWEIPEKKPPPAEGN